MEVISRGKKAKKKRKKYEITTNYNQEGTV